MGECKFDMLFTINVPHILEKIFFHLDYASFKKCTEVNTVWHKLLTSKSFKRLGKSIFREEIEWELWHAVCMGNAFEVRRIISGGMVDVNYKQRDITPLYLASREGLKDVVQLLLKGGADANIGCRDDNLYPMHEAAYQGDKDLAQLLLAGGAEVNMQTTWGATPLLFAIENDHRDLVQLLLERGADPNMGPKSMLEAALLHDFIDVVKLLLNNGAEPNQLSPTGWAPLHLAASAGQKNAVQLLLDAGAEVNTVNLQGATPLTKAYENGHTAIVNLLKDNGGTE